MPLRNLKLNLAERNHGEWSTPKPLVLASFEFAIELTYPESNRSYITEEEPLEEQKFESYLWRRRHTLAYQIEQEIQNRLSFTKFGKYIKVSTRLERGSIVGLITFLSAVGLAYELVANYKDFVESFNLIIEQSQDLIAGAVNRILRNASPDAPALTPIIQIRNIAAPVMLGGRFTPDWRRYFSPRNFLRIIVIFISILFLMRHFTWGRELLGEIWQRPDLTHQIIYQDKEAVFILSNQGYYKARQVLVNLDVFYPKITYLRVVSHEEYQWIEQEMDQGVIRLWLERLSPGASIIIWLNGDQPIVLDRLLFSGVSEAGISREVEATGKLDHLPQQIDPLGSFLSAFEKRSGIALEYLSRSSGPDPIFALSLQDMRYLARSEDFHAIATFFLYAAIFIWILYNYRIFFSALFLFGFLLAALFLNGLALPGTGVIGIIGLGLIAMLLLEFWVEIRAELVTFTLPPGALIPRMNLRGFVHLIRLSFFGLLWMFLLILLENVPLNMIEWMSIGSIGVLLIWANLWVPLDFYFVLTRLGQVVMAGIANTRARI
jgi:hypothetical protein